MKPASGPGGAPGDKPCRIDSLGAKGELPTLLHGQVEEKFEVEIHGDPGAFPEFFFELTVAPSGIAEGKKDPARGAIPGDVLEHLQRCREGEAFVDNQGVLRHDRGIPGIKDHPTGLGRDRTSLKNRDRRPEQAFVVEIQLRKDPGKVDGGGLVDDEAEGAFLFVVDEKHDRATEERALEARRGDEERRHGRAHLGIVPPFAENCEGDRASRGSAPRAGGLRGPWPSLRSDARAFRAVIDVPRSRSGPFSGDFAVLVLRWGTPWWTHEHRSSPILWHRWQSRRQRSMLGAMDPLGKSEFMPSLRANLRMLRFATRTTQALVGWEVRSRFTASPEELAALKHQTKLRTAAGMLDVFGVEVVGQSSLAKASRPRLIVANHRTAFDIGVLMSVLGGTFLSRSDLAGWPVVGRLAKAGDTIFVDRGNRSSGARAIRSIRRHLKAGLDVIVFPEGATFAGDEVRPFRGGAFAAARGLEVDVLPVGLAFPEGSEYVEKDFVTHLRDIAARRRTVVGVCFGESFETRGTKESALRAEEEVRKLVRRAREARRNAGRTGP